MLEESVVVVLGTATTGPVLTTAQCNLPRAFVAVLTPVARSDGSEVVLERSHATKCRCPEGRCRGNPGTPSFTQGVRVRWSSKGNWCPLCKTVTAPCGPPLR